MHRQVATYGRLVNAGSILSVLISGLVALTGIARSDAHDLMAKSRLEQEKRDAWFSSLKRPNAPTLSCCNLSDCHQTLAEFRRNDAGHWRWWAVVEGLFDGKLQRRWLVIPPEKVLDHPRSIDGQ